LQLFQECQDAHRENWVLLHLGQVYTQLKRPLFALAFYEAVLNQEMDNSPQTHSEQLLMNALYLIRQLCEAIYPGQKAIACYEHILQSYRSKSRPY
jgi:hypothetical protein